MTRQELCDEILARDPLTRFSDRDVFLAGCDLRDPVIIAGEVDKALVALAALGMLPAGDWPAPVPPKAFTRSLVQADKVDA